jgi:ABC-type sugar transport system ATPase subunit
MRFGRQTYGKTVDRHRSATLKSQGVAVVLISHRLTDVFSVCDRIVVLRLGTVIADDAIRDSSKNAVVARIVGATDAPNQGAHP